MSIESTPTARSADTISAWNVATECPGIGNDTARPSIETTSTVCERKSRSIEKVGSGPIGRVVMPRPVRWKGTFHQWLRRGLAASRILPITCANRCSVGMVSDQLEYGIGGNSSISGYLRRGDGRSG
jgi:hypothetical protein